MEPAGRASELAWRASEPAVRAPEPAGRALEPSERTLESARRVSGPAGRALMPVERLLEPAERALKPAERALETWEGQLGAPGGGTETERETDRQNGAFLVCGGTIGHRPLRGRCPKVTLHYHQFSSVPEADNNHYKEGERASKGP